MSESYEESQQRISNQRAENLMSAHKRIGELKGEIAELQAKLAEQQAIVANFFKMYGKDVSEAGFEELNNLLAKAKEEGMKEIEELQRHNAMLVEALQFYANECHIGDTCGGGYYGIIDDSKRTRNALQATSAQSAAWLEASHIEWRTRFAAGLGIPTKKD